MPDAECMLSPVGETVDLSMPNRTHTFGEQEPRVVCMDLEFDPERRAIMQCTRTVGRKGPCCRCLYL